MVKNSFKWFLQSTFLYGMKMMWTAEIQVEMKKNYDQRSGKWNLSKCKLTQKILCRIIYSY